MTDFHIRMTLVVDESEVPAVKARLAECVAEFDVRPSFTTIVAWLVEATAQLKNSPPPKARGSGPEGWMGVSRVKRKGYKVDI